MNTEIISTTEALLSRAEPWNNLWSRSQATEPTLRAEHVAMWVEHFAPDAEFRAILVWDGEQLAAALPLVSTRVKKVIQAGGGVFNSWSPNGDLLLDESADYAAALDELVAAIDDLPWPMIWLDEVAIESTRWMEFTKAAQRRNLVVDVSEKHTVGLMSTQGDWEQFRQRWSKSLRKHIGRQIRNLEKLPGYSYRIESPRCPKRAIELMRIGFEVEDKSWKGENGSSVLKSPGMEEFYYRQGAELAEQGCLALAFLSCDEGPISYEYSWKCKGVFHSFKVGYDPAYHKQSPGQALMHNVLQECFGDDDISLLNCMGPMSPALRSWRPDEFKIGRIVTAPKSLLGKALVYGYKQLRGVLQRFSA